MIDASAAVHDDGWEVSRQIINTMPRAYSEREGRIYLMQLYPPNRFKVGYTKDEDTLKGRLREARTWVPEAEVIGQWPALEKWEKQARYVMRSRRPVAKALAEFPHSDWSREAGGEVIDADGKERLIERGESLFTKFLTLEDDE